jgi:integrase
VRQRIEAILDWATVRNFRRGPNPAAWKGHLDHLLPKPAKVRRVEHHAALPYAELGAFMAELRRQEGVGARALELAILTAARTGEVLGATWSEINLAERLWTIPAERMKSGREHRAPLSAPAVEILEEMAAIRSGEIVFPGARPGRPLSNMSMLMLLRRMGRDDLTAHGFRSSFCDWAAEATHFPAEVAEMALAHTVGDKVEAAYRRGDLFQPPVDGCLGAPLRCIASGARGRIAAPGCGAIVVDFRRPPGRADGQGHKRSDPRRQRMGRRGQEWRRRSAPRRLPAPAARSA